MLKRTPLKAKKGFKQKTWAEIAAMQSSKRPLGFVGSGFKKKDVAEVIAKMNATNQAKREAHKVGILGYVDGVQIYKPGKPLLGNGLKRTKLAKKSKSPATKLRDEIQATLRAIVIKRDGGCILRNSRQAGPCSHFRKDGELILQAEHLVTRGASNYFGDLRNVICLCRGHHTNFKPTFSKLYWELVEKVLGPDRWNWYMRANADNRPYKVDMKLVLLDLKNKLAKI